MRIGRFYKTQGQRGDTIIEVLIAIAVVSLILASSYAITNRNVLTGQDTQEHSQAQQIVQQQIELLRALVQPGGTFTTLGGCITRDGSGDPVSTPAAGCKFNADGTSGCTAEPCYSVAITKDAPTGIYTITASWGGLNGSTARVSMSYGV